MKKYFDVFFAATICVLLAFNLSACGSSSQAQINTVVADIANWTPIISSDATALLTDIASFEPQDAATIQGFVTTMNTDSTLLTTLCTQYLAAPSASVLAQISSLVGQLATNDALALLAVLQIKNASSQLIAKGILTTIATAVTILAGYLATVSTPSPATVKALDQLKPYVNRTTLVTELQKARMQGIVPKGVTLSSMGY